MENKSCDTLNMMMDRHSADTEIVNSGVSVAGPQALEEIQSRRLSPGRSSGALKFAASRRCTMQDKQAITALAKHKSSKQPTSRCDSSLIVFNGTFSGQYKSSSRGFRDMKSPHSPKSKERKLVFSH